MKKDFINSNIQINKHGKMTVILHSLTTQESSFSNQKSVRSILETDTAPFWGKIATSQRLDVALCCGTQPQKNKIQIRHFLESLTQYVIYSHGKHLVWINEENKRLRLRCRPTAPICCLKVELSHGFTLETSDCRCYVVSISVHPHQLPRKASPLVFTPYLSAGVISFNGSAADFNGDYSFHL